MKKTDESGQHSTVVKTKEGGFRFFPFQAELAHAYMEIHLKKSDSEPEENEEYPNFI